MSTLKETATHSAIYSLGNLAVKMAGLVMLPIITANLSIGEYGVFGLIESVTQLGVGLLSLKLPIAAMRLAGNHADDGRQKALFTHSLLILLGVSALLFAFCYLLAGPIGWLITGDSGQRSLVLLVSGSIIFEILGLVPIYYLRFKNRSTVFVTLMLLKLAVLIGLIYYLLQIKQLGVIGLVGSFFGANLIFLLLSLLLVYVQPVTYRFNKEEAKSLISFGTPLIFTSVITILLTTSDRYIIRIFHEFADIGVYSLSVKIAGIVTFVLVNSFFLAYTPIAYKKHSDSNFMKLQPTILTFVVLLSMITIWFLSLFSEDLLLLATSNPDYLNSSIYIPYLGVVIGFAAIQNFVSMSFHYANKTAQNIPIVSVALLVNIVLAFILIPIHPIYGALASSMVAMFVMVVMTYREGKKVYPDVLGTPLLMKLMLLVSAGSAVCILVNYIPQVQSLGVRVLVFLLLSFVGFKLFNINIKQVTYTLRSWFGI
jgi:O-antigen/teichoic acid export membrane protein